MRQLESLRVFLNERLTAAAEEIFGAVEKTVEEYHDENEHLRRLLGITPEITISKIGSMQFSLPVYEEEVSPEQQHCVQEWSPSLRQEDPEPTHVKEEPEELRTSQEEEQLQWIFDNKNSILIPPCVKSECDQEDPCWSLTLPQTQTVGNRDSDSKPEDVQPFDPVTQLKGLDIPCDPPDIHNVSSHSSDLNSDPVGHDVCPSLDPSTTPRKTYRFPDSGETSSLKADSPSLDPSQSFKKHQCTKPRNTLRCSDCGKMFALKADLEMHLICNKHTPRDCGKSFNLQPHLRNHILTHPVEKPFSCAECGKSFNQKIHLIRHTRTHTGEKPFNCADCGKSFYTNGELSRHVLTHPGEKPFNCAECGKGFLKSTHLTRHQMTHTGEKRFSCDDCGKRFSLNKNLSVHKLTHTGVKPFSCGDCGKSFSQKWSLTYHIQTHTGVELFSCSDCGKSFSQKGSLSKHKLTHTGEKCV